MRRRKSDWSNASSQEASIDMSPLIDCVFLLLIFFLVTTMFKRKERLIPIVLPDQSSQISSSTEDKTLVFGLNIKGQLFVRSDKRGQEGELKYNQISDLELYLQGLIAKKGEKVKEMALRIDCDRETPFQKCIDALDICKLNGFLKASVKTRNRKD